MFMKDFFDLKLRRAIWVSFLKEENIKDGIDYFEKYISSLNDLCINENLKKDLNSEILLSKKIFVSFLNSLSDQLYQSKKYTEALICLVNCYKYKKDDIDIIEKIIVCMENCQQKDLEAALYEKLEILSKDNINAYKTLSKLYESCNDTNKAIKYYEKYYIAKSKNLNADELNLYGCLYNKLYNEKYNIEDAFKSLEFFQKALEIDKLNDIIIKNAIIMSGLTNNVKLEKQLWKIYMANFELSNDDKFDYAAFCLKNSDFENWYKYFDARFQKENNATIFPKLPAPLWHGTEDIKNSTLLIHYEQGFGDTFWITGYIERLKSKAKKIIYVVQDEVADLIRSSNLGVEVYGTNEINLEEIVYDYYIPAMSVPIALRLNKNNISVGGGYIKPNNDIFLDMQDQICHSQNFKIGICCSGSLEGDKTRNIDLENFLPLDDIDGIEIFSLDKQAMTEDFKIFKKHTINNVVFRFNDFEQTAALIQNLDLVITTDNVILNLAGAMGKKTFALFNWSYQFRWFDLSGEDVVYYNSVKPFVNKEMNNWSFSIKKIVDEIQKILRDI